jgi:hypothetical protein
MRTPKMSFEQQGKFGFSAESVGEPWGKTEAKVEHPAPILVFEEYEHFKPAQNFSFAFRTA